jgi:ankyrin repeat protein
VCAFNAWIETNDTRRLDEIMRPYTKGNYGVDRPSGPNVVCDNRICDMVFDEVISSTRDVHEKIFQLVETFGAPLERIHESHPTYLARAVMGGDNIAVDALIKAGADVNDPALVKDIHIFFKYINETDWSVSLSMLLNAGLNVNLKDPYSGKTLLHRAVERQYLPIVRILLSRRIHMNVFTFNGHGRRNALHRAALVLTHSSAEIFKLLLEGGEDISATNSDGMTPMDMVKSNIRAGRPPNDDTQAVLQTIENFKIERTLAIVSATHKRLGNREDCRLGDMDPELLRLITNVAHQGRGWGGET